MLRAPAIAPGFSFRDMLAAWHPTTITPCLAAIEPFSDEEVCALETAHD